MATNIKCPNCGNEFPLEEAVSEEFKKELREQMKDYVKKKEDEFSKKEGEWQQQLQKKDNEFARQLQSEKIKLQQQLEESLRKTISADFENKVLMLEQNNKSSEEKLKEARQKELDYLKREQELKNKEAELEITTQRRLQEERSKLSEIIRKEEAERNSLKETEFLLKLREKDEKIDAIQRKAEEMQKRIEQGSMQSQGEAQELLLEEMLKDYFPFDVITEVGKGIRGADCIQTVRNNFGQECGKIIYESKRTAAFSNEWVEKLKVDMRSTNAYVAVIVTHSMPKDMGRFGEKDGVWICGFTEAKLVASILRDSIIKVYEANKMLDNVSDKKEQLYKYMTGNEFRQKWEAIIDAYFTMQKQLTKEKARTTKEWSEREKHLESMMKNAVGFIGDIKGIGGLEIKDIKLLEDDEE